ncbi:MAG TPA: 16S rRNA (guanine(966)-N(2))-methyltransferase RsmD [Jatrophihabitans sp.]|nr:16S rRNA (guanine(966)-N(2))-methyltransferase RsmD [Jatrophihabitans sp.]
MRIVAGLAKGRRLGAPTGDATRPTSDRAREALFSSLASLLDLAGARVLDLFAGTGAVGLEALSRGAAAAVLVESDRAAAEVLRRNADAVGLPGATVVRRTAAAYLADVPDEPFDLVFADPPYDLDDGALAELLAALGSRGWLAGDAIVVVERSARGAAPVWPEAFVTPVREKRYGAGVLWYGRRQ